MTNKYHDKDGEHEGGLTDAELAERIEALKAPQKKLAAAVDAEIHRPSFEVKPTSIAWSDMAKEQNEVVPELGDRDENHHEKQAKKQRKGRKR